MLGLREFSYAALVQQFFGVDPCEGIAESQLGAPAASARDGSVREERHPLSSPAGGKRWKNKCESLGRMEWFRQSCRRMLELTLVTRERDPDEAWRIAGSGTLSPQTCAVLRALWQWRDAEARLSDRPSFHILQNSALIEAAKQIVAGETPEFRHLSERRRHGFLAAARAESTRRNRTGRNGRRGRVEPARLASIRRWKNCDDAAIITRGTGDRALLSLRRGARSRVSLPIRCGARPLLVAWQRDLLGF